MSLQPIFDDAQRLILRLTGELEQKYQNILNKIPLDKYIRALDLLPAIVSYNYMSPVIAEYCLWIISDGGIAALALYHQLILATLIVRSKERLKHPYFTPDVIRLFGQNFSRIIKALDRNPPDFYQHSQDKFSKDLSTCLLRLIPLGAQKVNVNGIPRRLLLKSGFINGSQLFQYVFLNIGGFRSLYELHTDEHDPSALLEFTPEGWDRFYLRTASMLEINPQVKGIFGISWFFDPQLERISPRLNFLRERPLNSGGKFFFVSHIKDGSGGALAKSVTRRELFEKGEYIPANYLMIWPRNHLIHWARSIKNDIVYYKKLCRSL